MYTYDRTASIQIKDRLEVVLTFLQMKYLKSKGADFEVEHTYKISTALTMKVPVVMRALVFEAEVRVSGSNSVLSVEVNKRSHPLAAYVERLLLDEWHTWVDQLPPPR